MERRLRHHSFLFELTHNRSTMLVHFERLLSVAAVDFASVFVFVVGEGDWEVQF